jgi:hypothetical protein
MLKCLKIYDINSPKIRLGAEKDGGYVMPKIVLEKCTALFTYGVGGDTSYEVDFEDKYAKPVYMFDHTIGHENWEKGLQHFFNEGLGYQGCEDLRLKDVKEHYDSLGVQGEIFLKIDTEGAEYEYFLNADIATLASFVVGMVIEVHWLEQESNQIKFKEFMDKINNHFLVTHVHGNNWGGEFDYNGKTVPRVLEISFVNKNSISKYTNDATSFPLEGIDFPNNPNLPDCNLNFLSTL